MARPEGVSEALWAKVGQIFWMVANNHHAWGTLEQLPPEWADDLQERISRAILSAAEEEREACADAVRSLPDANNDPRGYVYATGWASGIRASEQAIRNRK